MPRHPAGLAFSQLAILFAVVALMSAASHARELPGIMVLNIKNEEQASPGLAQVLTELVLQQLHDTNKFRVVGQKDIDQMLSTEQRKQLAGCNDTSCLIEIAGAMGTQYTLDGTVGVVGQANILSLSLIDVTRAAVVSRKTAVLKGERERLLDIVKNLIRELLKIEKDTGIPLMVLNIKYEEEAGPGIAKILTELVLQDLHDVKLFKVVGEKDIDQMLSTEQRKQLAGCSDTSCLVEIAGAMGTKYTLDGTVGVVGKSNVLSLSLIDVTRATVVSKKTDVVKGQREQLLGSVHKLIYNLIGQVPELKKPETEVQAAAPANEKEPAVARTVVKPAPSRPMSPYRLWGHVGVWGGTALVATGGVFAILTKSAGDAYKTGKDPLGSRDDFDTYKATAIGTTVVGAIILGTGVTLWFLDPGEKTSRAMFVPQIGDHTAGLMVTGGW